MGTFASREHMSEWQNEQHVSKWNHFLSNTRGLDNRKHNVRYRDRVSTQKILSKWIFCHIKGTCELDKKWFLFRGNPLINLNLKFSVGMFEPRRISLGFERIRPKRLKKKLKNRDESQLQWVIFFCFKHFSSYNWTSWIKFDIFRTMKPVLIYCGSVQTKHQQQRQVNRAQRMKSTLYHLHRGMLICLLIMKTSTIKSNRWTKRSGLSRRNTRNKLDT